MSNDVAKAMELIKSGNNDIGKASREMFNAYTSSDASFMYDALAVAGYYLRKCQEKINDIYDLDID